MSDQLLNLSNELLLENEELNVEGHVKKSKDEPAEEKNVDEVEAHLLRQASRDL
jgi:hypothetical protein